MTILILSFTFSIVLLVLVIVFIEKTKARKKNKHFIKTILPPEFDESDIYRDEDETLSQVFGRHSDDLV